MKKGSRVILIFFVLSSTIFADTKPVLIGGLFDLSGPTSSISKAYFLGIKDYIGYINSQGVLARRIQLIYFDTKYNPSRAKQFAKKLIKKGVSAILGWGTGSSFAIRQLIYQARIPYIPASLCKELLTPPYNQFIFLPALSYAEQMETIVKFISEYPHLQDKSVAIISNPSLYGRKPIPYVTKYATQRHIKFSFIYYLPFDANIDQFATLKMTIDKFRPDILIIHSIPPLFLKIIALISTINGYNPTALIGTFYTYEPSLISKIPLEFLPKIFTITFFSLWYEKVPGMLGLYHFTLKKYGRVIKNIQYIEGGFNALLITEALKKIKGQVNGIKIKKALESIHNFSTGGLTPPISLSKQDHIAINKLRFLRIDQLHKRFSPVMSWISP